ncbi:hypothetical protein DEJ50_32995 [Streptomyces venezuelae]|uniref:Uncharacterized protein n=1 Tax=Streptomyces venezuelae TaxID=54571 RepID=A0A5P2DG23_STRVZ|nr:hypothetical protein DEJ50_32995 [Streptomyces venezuelae]
MRVDLTDAEWERLRPFLPVSNRRCGRWRDHRQVIDGILRHRLWSADGTPSFVRISVRRVPAPTRRRLPCHCFHLLVKMKQGMSRSTAEPGGEARGTLHLALCVP